MDRRNAQIVPPGAVRANRLGNPPTRGGDAPAPSIMPDQCSAKSVTLVMDGSIRQVARHDPNRVYLMIQNNGANNIYVTFGNEQGATKGFLIKKNGFLEPRVTPIDAIFISGTNGDQVSLILGQAVGG